MLPLTYQTVFLGVVCRLGFCREFALMEPGTGTRKVLLRRNEVEHALDSAKPLPALSRRRPPQSVMMLLDVCFARVMRRAVLGLLTRSARAISAVVRPSAARRRSATPEIGVRDG
jgi:hypothetical protein